VGIAAALNAANDQDLQGVLAGLSLNASGKLKAAVNHGNGAGPMPVELERLVSPAAPELVRGMSGVFNAIRGDHRSISDLVAEVLKNCGWADLDRDSILVEDKSGHGGSTTYKVAAPGAEPPVVAVHARSVSSVADPVWERRMEVAAKELARHGLAPRRFAQGGDWFIEEWEGNGIGEVQLASELKEGNTSVQELAQLMAKVHQVPPAWFDDFREQLGIVKAGLQEAPKGSCVWWPSCRVTDMLENESDEVLMRLVMAELKPRTEAGSRIVTVHGDMHAANIIRTEGAGLKVIDLEFTHANHAIFDLAYTLRAVCHTAAMRRAFAEAYLEAMDYPHDQESVEALLLEAMWYSSLNLHGSVLWADAKKAKELPESSFEDYRKFEEVIVKASSCAALRQDIIEHGFMECGACTELNAERKRLEYANLEPRLPPVDASLCKAAAPAVLEAEAASSAERWALDVAAQDLTFSCWMILSRDQSELPEPMNEDYSLTMCAAECTNGLGDFDISWHKGGIVFMLRGNRVDEKKKGEDAVAFSYRGLANSKWHHVAVCYSSADKDVKLYVDGGEVETHAFRDAWPVRLTTVTLGEFRENKHVHKFLVDSTRFPEGQLRSIKLHTRVLPPEEVNALQAEQSDANLGGDGPFPVPAAVHGGAPWSEPLGCTVTETAAAEEVRQQMVEQVMAMGFDIESAQNALEATGWASVEVAIGVLLG